MGNVLELCKKIKITDRTAYELSLFFPGTAINTRKGQDITWYEYCKLENPNYVAIVNYDKQDLDEISLKKNDLIILLNARGNYFLIKNLRTRLIGKVPKSAVKSYSQPRMEPCFHKNITKFDAERFLNDSNCTNEAGCYLLRDSSSMEIALSVLSVNSYTNERKVYHYLIKKNDFNKYYIENKNSSNLRYFQSIDELLNFYKSNKELCCKLGNFYKKSSEFEIEWEVERSRVYMLKEIGGGQFGIVYKAKLKLQKEYDVAVKMIRNLTNEKQKELFINECNLMKRLKHDKIIKLYCISSKEEPMWMILEYMSNGSLKNYLKNKKTELKFKTLIDIIIQIASGMKHLEEIQVIHRDLSARNVLVGKDNLVKIGDFGLSQKILDGEIINYKVELPIKWMAPEVLNTDPIYTTKSDVWSFGILLYEVITLGGDPYPRNDIEKQEKDSYSNDEVKLKILNGYRMDMPKGLCTPAFYSIMKDCWKQSSEERPTFEALFNSFFDYFVKSEPQYQMN